jgi:hypothetical protein
MNNRRHRNVQNGSFRSWEANFTNDKFSACGGHSETDIRIVDWVYIGLSKDYGVLRPT